MSTKVQIIDPREMGQRQIRLNTPMFDEDAIARADKTLDAMGASFARWLEADVRQLQTARVAAEAAGWNSASLRALFAAAHDLKGMGATYGYPLITQIAASLCRLIETEDGQQAARANPALACAHVDAVRAALRGQIASDQHAVGKTVLQALDAQVAALGVAPR
jgi:chemotaxis protein histidine kinase CheA